MSQELQNRVKVLLEILNNAETAGLLLNRLNEITADPLMLPILGRSVSLCLREVLPDPGAEESANWRDWPDVRAGILNEVAGLVGNSDEYDPIMKFLRATPHQVGNSAWADWQRLLWPQPAASVQK